MYNNSMFPRTPDSFRQKVEQVVQENMKTTVGTEGHEKSSSKSIFEKIIVKRKLEEDIMRNVIDINKDKHVRKKYGWQKKVGAAVVVLAVVGTGSFTVHAVVDSIVKTRMESMPKEEKSDLVDEVDKANVNASTYSREFTQEEKEREKELTIAYQKDGRFPEGELKIVEDEGKVDKDMLCFVPETSYFYLPDRNLTDEELLQIIDYSNKVNYALQERYKEKHFEEVAAQEKKEKEARQKLEEEGAISEDEAVAKAQEWLEKLCGTTGEDMELNYYIDTDTFGKEEAPVHQVDWTIDGEEYCSFYIDAHGTLLSFMHSDNASSTSVDAEEMPISEAEKKVTSLRQTAEKCLKDSFGISENYKKVYCVYRKTVDGNKVSMNRMTFSFVQEDGKAYAVTLSCVDEYLEDYEVIDKYDEKLKEEVDKEIDAQKIRGGVMCNRVRVELE